MSSYVNFACGVQERKKLTADWYRPTTRH